MNTAIQPTASTNKPNHDRIAALAYHFWEKDGRKPGHDLDYWLQAEKRLNGGNSRRANGGNSRPGPVGPVSAG